MNDALHELHLRAGKPSLSDMHVGLGHAAPRSMIHAIFKEPQVRQWGVYEVVLIFLASRAPGADVNGERQRLHDLWVAAEQEDRLAAERSSSLPTQAISDDRVRQATVSSTRETLEILDRLINKNEQLPLHAYASLLDRSDPELARTLRTFSEQKDPDVWLPAAIELCKKFNEAEAQDGTPTEFSEMLAVLEPMNRFIKNEAELSADDLAVLLDQVDPEAAGLMRTWADDSAPAGSRIRAALDLLDRLESREN